MRQDIDITNFTAGEISPKLKGRVDLQKYFNGAESLLNMVVLPQGGATRRPGTRYVYDCKDQAHPCRLVPFIFSTQQRYVLEFSDGNARVFTNGGAVLSGGSPVDISLPYAWSDIWNLKFAQSADTLYPCSGDFQPAAITRSSDTAWSYGAITFRDGPYLDVNTTDTTLSPNGTAGAITINASSTTGINDNAGFLTTDVGRLLRIKLFSLWAWCVITARNSTTQVVATVQGKVDFGADGAIDGVSWAANTDYPTGKVVVSNGVYYQASIGGRSGPSGSSGPAGTGSSILDGTITWSMVGGYNSTAWHGNTQYVVGDIVSGKQGNFYICVTGGTSASGGSGAGPTGTGSGIVDNTVVWNYLPAFTFPTATKQWRLGRWNGTAGWPLSVRFWQQRQFWGGHKGSPNSVNGSQTADFTNMAPTTADGTVTDANALDWTIDDDQVNAIHALVSAGSAQSMQLGLLTDAGEHILQAATTAQALTPTSVQAYGETAYGSAVGVDPLRIGKAVLFADRAARKVREWSFSWQSNGYIGPDLMQVCEHLTRQLGSADTQAYGIKQWAWQAAPLQIIWACLNGGDLVSFTYDREQSIWAGCRHRLGGSYYGGWPRVESVCVIPSQDGTYDELWLAVLRTINGTPKRTIEVMTRFFDAMAPDDAVFVDCSLSSALTYPGATLAFSGFVNKADDISPPAYAGEATLIANANVWSAASIGSVVRANGGKAVITGYTDEKHVTADVTVAFNSLAPVPANEWSCTPAAATAGGLDHLSGETVSVLGDGADMDDAAVVDGSITLKSRASYVTAGLPCPAAIIGNPFEPARAAAAATNGKMKVVDALWARFHETIGCEFGMRMTDDMTEAQQDYLEPLQDRQAADLMDNVPPLMSRAVKLRPQGGYDREGQFIVMQDRPLPLTLIGLFASGDVAEMPGT